MTKVIFFTLIFLAFLGAQPNATPDNNQAKPNQESGPAKSQSPSPTIAPSKETPSIQVANNPDTAAANHSEPSETKTTDIILTIANVLIFFAIVVQAYIYNKQRILMWKQWVAMRRGLAKTQNIISQNERIIEKMQGQLDVMKKQAGHAESQVKVMGDTLDETKRIFNLTERPVVIAISAEIEGGIAPNKPLRPKVTFANKGRTAAQHFNVTAEIAAKKGHAWIWGFGDTGIEPSGDMFIPANSDPQTVIGAPANAITIDDAFYNDVCYSREVFIIHGKGSYEDLAGQQYPIKYAFHFLPEYGFGNYHVEKWKEPNPEKGNQN